ncbi:MAG: DNA-binding protein, partial [Pseudanabaena sp.]
MRTIESILADIDKLKAELDILRQSLDNVTIKEALEVEFLYESNRIEGNTLTLRETQLVINEGMTISGKSMREHLEAINHK